MARAKTAAIEWVGVPTAERFIQSDGHVEVGGDERGARIYRFNDTSLARIYGRLKAHARGGDQLKATEAEERALQRYGAAYIEGALNGNMPSVDLGNACFQGGAGRDHAAKNAWQMDHRDDFHRANSKLTQNQREVLKIIVLVDGSTEQAGRYLGKMSRRRASQSGTHVLREAGQILALFWGMLTSAPEYGTIR